MRTTLINLAVLITGAVIFYGVYFNDEAPESKQEVSGPAYLGVDNKPVFMAGCQTFHRPVPPKVVYPTVKKNFMALVCALEVYPPFGVIALQRNSQVQDTKVEN